MLPFFPTPICHEIIRLDAMILVFWMLNGKPFFSLFSFTLIKGLFSSPLLSAISGIICISPDNFDYSLWFIQPGISHYVLYVEGK